MFRDRIHAGRELARALPAYAGRDDVVVLAIPRGGVPVGYEVASALRAPLDVFLVRKLGVPGHEELAMGAIGSGGVRVLNDRVLATLEIRPETIERVAVRERAELARREAAYRGNRAPLAVGGRIAIVVDDGLATGASMRAAVAALRRLSPREIVVAVPVGAAATVSELQGLADRVVCLGTPEPFFGVGQFYADFSQTSDDDVRELLARAHSQEPRHDAASK